MNEQLIETITKIVIEKLQTRNLKASNIENEALNMPVKLFNNEPSAGKVTLVENIESPQGDVKFHETTRANQKLKVVKKQVNQSDASSKDAQKEEYLEGMRKTTPARIAVGRAGSRPKTNTWLLFRYDHAAAVDAVYGEVPKEILERLNLFQVHTRVQDKEEYIRRPDLGRRLSDEAKKIVKEKCKTSPRVQIVASNGLSAKALEVNLEDVYLSLMQSLKNLNIDVGTSFYVDKGRVALMDEIGEILQPDVVIILIGERPGLVSAESLSAYMCYKPRIGTIEADRMVVSNIHKGGIPPVEAGAYLGTLIEKILKFEASGVSLVKKE